MNFFKLFFVLFYMFFMTFNLNAHTLKLKRDSSYLADLQYPLSVGDTMYIQLEGLQGWHTGYSNDTGKVIVSNQITHQIIHVTLSEAKENVFRGIAKIRVSTDDANDEIGCNTGDLLTVKFVPNTNIVLDGNYEDWTNILFYKQVDVSDGAYDPGAPNADVTNIYFTSDSTYLYYLYEMQGVIDDNSTGLIYWYTILDTDPTTGTRNSGSYPPWWIYFEGQPPDGYPVNYMYGDYCVRSVYDKNGASAGYFGSGSDINWWNGSTWVNMGVNAPAGGFAGDNNKENDRVFLEVRVAWSNIGNPTNWAAVTLKIYNDSTSGYDFCPDSGLTYRDPVWFKPVDSIKTSVKITNNSFSIDEKNALLRGTFLALSGTYNGWSVLTWEQKLQDILNIGEDTIVIQYSAYDNHSYYDSSQSFINDEYPNVLPNLMQAADNQGINVVMATYYDNNWFSQQTSDAFIDQQITRNSNIIGEIVTNFGITNYSSFAGWYIPYEIDNVTSTNSAGKIRLKRLFNGIADYCKTLTPGKPVMTSPFFNIIYMKPEGWFNYWDELLQGISNLDVVIQQTGIGVDHSHLTNIGPYFDAVRRACISNNRIQWADIEVFHNSQPTNIQSVRTQLLLTRPYVSKMISYEYLTYMDKSGSAQAQVLYTDYHNYYLSQCPDTTAPTISSETTPYLSDSTLLHIVFNEKVNEVIASVLTNYIINSSINPISIVADHTNMYSVTLKFASPVPGGYTLELKHIEDLYKNSGDTNTTATSNSIIHYVAKSGSQTYPYDTPAKAAWEFQTAINISSNGHTIIGLDNLNYNPFFVENLTNFVIKSSNNSIPHITANYAGATPCSLKIKNSSDIRISGLYVEKASNDAVRITNSINVSFISNTTSSCWSAGIRVWHSSNVNIKRNSVFKNWDGILAWAQSKEIFVENNSVYSNHDGIHIGNMTRNSSVKSNNVTYNKHAGIWLSLEADGTEVEYNTCSYNSNNGIFLSDSIKNSRVNRNMCEHNNNGIVMANSTNNTITSNILDWNTFDGMYLTSLANYNYINNNIVYSNSSQGIEINNSKQNIIFGNQSYGHPNNGILMNASGNSNYILKNIAHHNGWGNINIYNSMGNIVQKNICYGGWDGIVLSTGSTYNTIINNTVYKSVYGIYQDNSINNTYKNNITMGNTTKGYLLAGAGSFLATYSCSFNENHGDANGGNFISGVKCVTNNPYLENPENQQFNLNWNSICQISAESNVVAGSMGAFTASVIPKNLVASGKADYEIAFSTLYKIGSIPSDGKIEICFTNKDGNTGFGLNNVTKVTTTSLWGGSKGDFNVSSLGQKISISRSSGTASVAGQTENLILSFVSNESVFSAQNTNYYIMITIKSNNDTIIEKLTSNFFRLINTVDLHLVKQVDNIQLNGNNSKAIPGATIEYKIIYTNYGPGFGYRVNIFDRLPQNSVFMSNSISNVGNWIVEYSTNAIPDQQYNSLDYTSVTPAVKFIKWIRFKIDETSEADHDFYYKVSIK